MDYSPVSYPDVKRLKRACLLSSSELIDCHDKTLRFVKSSIHATNCRSHLLIHLIEFQIMQMPIERILQQFLVDARRRDSALVQQIKRIA